MSQSSSWISVLFSNEGTQTINLVKYLYQNTLIKNETYQWVSMPRIVIQKTAKILQYVASAEESHFYFSTLKHFPPRLSILHVRLQSLIEKLTIDFSWLCKQLLEVKI